MGTPTIRVIDVLLLCTANQCRSPMAEALLRHRLAEAGVPATVSSAGLYEGGAPATAHGVATMAARGIDVSNHCSRRVDERLVEDADLVIAMARQHASEAAVLADGALAKTFTLKELVRHATEIGPRAADEPLSDWLARIAARRRPDDLLGVGHDDDFDVADPIGRSRSDYEATARLLDDLLGRLVALAWPAETRAAAVGSRGRAS